MTRAPSRCPDCGGKMEWVDDLGWFCDECWVSLGGDATVQTYELSARASGEPASLGPVEAPQGQP